MIKLRNIMSENSIFVPRRSREERAKSWKAAIYKQIQAYIRNGSRDDLDLSNSPIERLPDNLKRIGGNLWLFNTQITSLPDDLRVGGGLYLYNTPITSLPNNLHVGGSLTLSYTKITSLPNNLHVGGYLDLRHTPITSLPNNLRVDGSLYLENTQITSLSDNLHVGGSLWLRNTPVSRKYTEEQIRAMLPGVKRSIYK